jgi:hypothetical protein
MAMMTAANILLGNDDSANILLGNDDRRKYLTWQ